MERSQCLHALWLSSYTALACPQALIKCGGGVGGKESLVSTACGS